MFNDTRISVIIPTLEAGKYIDKCLSSLHNQLLQLHEIMVIDSSSSDETVEVSMQAGCIVEVIPKSDFNHGRTRNLGVQLAQGDLLVFMTQDALPTDKYFLEKLVRPIQEGRAVAAYARQIPYPDANPLEVFNRNFNYSSKSHIKTINNLSRMGIKTFFFSNVASAVSREAFLSVGGFPNKVITNEDMLLCARLLQAGYAVAYQAEAKVYHSHNYSLIQLFKRYFDMGVFIVQADDLLQGVSAGKGGVRFVFEQLKYLVCQRELAWVLHSVIEGAVKFVACNLGKLERFIPTGFKRKLSMHSFFWD